MKVVYSRVAIFGLKTLSVLAGQTTPIGTGTSTPSPSACTSCAVAAEEFYLSYPYSISTVTSPVTVTVVPYITPHEDGPRETNWRTETLGPNGPASVNGSLAIPEPKPTWEPFSGVTLTYPTTYVNFPSPYGGLDFFSNGACVTATAPLALPTNSEQRLIYPVTISNWDTKLPWNVTQQLLDYLDSIPAVSQQFHGTKVGSCEWATYVTPTSSALPITKVTVQYLTAQTAQAVIVTRESTPASMSANLPTASTRNVSTAALTSTASAALSPTSTLTNFTFTSSTSSTPAMLSALGQVSGGTRPLSSFGSINVISLLLIIFSSFFFRG